MDIWDRISELGVKLIYTNDLPPQRLGCYLDDERTIMIRASLHGALELETLAHEYVHAVYRDRTKHPAIEWRAWREAARLLVDDDGYAAAAKKFDDGYRFEGEISDEEHRFAFADVGSLEDIRVMEPRADESGAGWATGETTRFGRLAHRLWHLPLQHESMGSE